MAYYHYDHCQCYIELLVHRCYFLVHSASYQREASTIDDKALVDADRQQEEIDYLGSKVHGGW